MLSRPVRSSHQVLLLTIAIVVPSRIQAQTIASAMSAEISRERSRLDGLPASPFVDGDRPRLKSLLDDAEALIKSDRMTTAIETLSSATPGVIAMSRAATGWDDSGKGPGKHLDALTKEWEMVGVALRADRPRFPEARPEGQTAFIRAMAEQSMGQIDEHYAVAVDYARFSGVSAGAYYLGRAEGQLAWALTLSNLNPRSSRPVRAIPSLAREIARIEDDIVTAYAKPGSTAQHTNFILANSSLKLAKELDQHGLRLGALATVLRSLFSLSLATMPTPGPEQLANLAAQADAFERRFGASGGDESIGEAFVEKARIALEKSQSGGDAADRERLRAAALLNAVVPRYIEVMEGLPK